MTVYKFWADSRRSALSVLRAYSADHPGETFYYGTSGDYIRRNGTRGDDFDDMILELTGRRAKAKAATERRRFAAERKRTEQERREVFASFRAFLDTLRSAHPRFKGLIKDFRFFLRYYDMASGTSRQRNEAWSIDGAILDLLDFNLPRLAKNHSGVPNEFCIKAREMLGEKAPADGNISKKAMDLADRLWREEIEKLHLYIRLYRFYADHCTFDRRNADEVSLYEQYKDTIPYWPGTFGDLDYLKLEKLVERYWRLWIEQFRKIGRSLWD